jgi:SP family facilitated glucose transporter-like MFS transporter 1
MMLSQQLSGINAAIFFSTQIFESAGLDEQTALYSTLGMGVINILMTLVSLVLIERAGRRTLHLTGLGGMAGTTVVLVICLTFSEEVPFLRYVSILAVFAFIVMFATGPGSIPWFLVSELFGVGARGLATSLAVAVNWSANIAVGLCFLPLTHVLGNSTFLVFTVLLIFFWIYTYRKVPETKGKSIDEIAAVFRQQAYQ